ncbi:sigma-70 family RNA polymerase sigma factor [Arthrobacter castelli]|uniref:sigma-70 family RNA polymerase sigma factor n=1 Tax=Arthrobacter castelli TaxID=271431 RepID=UPI0004254258|nr:sigma-70 family RNA polymerase sigma factor [Arthrobacter castelli]
MPDQAEALRMLYDQHAPELLRFVTRLTQDRALADDVVQETLLRAWQRPAVLERPEPALRAWLFTVARHLVVDDRRSARHRHEIGTDRPPDQSTRDRSDEVLDTWLVAEALSTLSREHREVIVAAYYRGESTVVISERLDIPEGTVKSRMHYGLRALRLSLQEKGVTR